MIISSVETAKECEFNIKFDPTLVRGQSYYTGTIFEVTMDDFGGSVAGGGRYDKMIGKFTGAGYTCMWILNRIRTNRHAASGKWI